MEIRDSEQFCIFTPLSKKLSAIESRKLLSDVLKEKRFVGIDLSYVYDCTIDFIEEISKAAKSKQIGIFNIPSDIFAVFNIMQLDKTLNLYVSESDFEENSRRLINRNFAVV